jgi:hypothetical protein
MSVSLLVLSNTYGASETDVQEPDKNKINLCQALASGTDSLYMYWTGPTGDQTMKNETATLIGIVAGVAYYENPVLGDEAPLMIKVGGELIETEYWELSDADDNA